MRCLGDFTSSIRHHTPENSGVASKRLQPDCSRWRRAAGVTEACVKRDCKEEERSDGYRVEVRTEEGGTLL